MSVPISTTFNPCNGPAMEYSAVAPSPTFCLDGMLVRTLASIMICALCGPFAFAGPGDAPGGEAHGRFRNNYPEPPPQSFWVWKWEQWREGLPKPPPGGWNLPHMRADVEGLRANRERPTITWIGHSSFLVQLAGANVLFAPPLSPRASPVAFAGPKRSVPLPLELDQLPPIDVVAISHNHYDHLDVETVRRLASQPAGSPLFLVPLGLVAWFRALGIERVVELGWWQDHEAAGLRFTLAPVQHWSKRTLWDTNETLWGAWIAEGGGLKVIHAGDLGYSKDTQDIGERLGPFDLAMIPIGA